MIKIAITGGIGSGKSAVCRYLNMEGIPVYNCDNEVKRLYDTDENLVKRLVDILGNEILSKENSEDESNRMKIDKKKFASIIFSDQEALTAVEAIVHPLILNDFHNWCAKQEEKGEEVIALESALLLEKALFKGEFDSLILVDAPYETRLERAALRDKVSKDVIKERMENQVIYNKVSETGDFPECVDYFIINDSDEYSLHLQIDEVLRLIISSHPFE